MTSNFAVVRARAKQFASHRAIATHCTSSMSDGERRGMEIIRLGAGAVAAELASREAKKRALDHAMGGHHRRKVA